jgi:hypothetical protein
MHLEGGSGVFYPNINWSVPEDDDYKWAITPIRRMRWALAVGPQVGIDQQKLDDLYLGFALRKFLADDANISLVRFSSFSPQFGLASKRNILMRVNWELQAPNMPSNIGNVMEDMREKIVLCRCRTLSGWQEASKYHLSAIDQANALARLDTTLPDLVIDPIRSTPKLQTAWEEYQNLLDISS